MSKFWKFYFVPMFLIIVAINQLILVENNLTRWKGGGFGMYSEHHFSDFEIWTSSKEEIDWNKAQLSDAATKLKRKPNYQSAFNFLKKINIEMDTLVIQVWKPKLEFKDFQYRRELIYELIAVKNIDY